MSCMQGVIASMTAQMARLEAQAERTEREYRSELKEDSHRILLRPCRASVCCERGMSN